MLGFLRRLRRTLIEEGHLRKYLVYAVGEILLVVIGILIALQFNNWSQYKQARMEEQDLLRALVQELQHNDRLLAQTVSDIDYGIQRLDAFLETNLEEVKAISEDSVSFGIVRPIRRFFTTELAVGALHSAVNSGKLDLIENSEIRSKLAQYLASVDDSAELASVVSETSIEALKIIGEYPELRIFFYSTNVVPSKKETISAETLRGINTDPKLKSLLAIKMQYWIAYSTSLQRLSSQMQEIEDLIDTAITTE